MEFSNKWQVLRRTTGSHEAKNRAAASMYELFSAHMRQHLVDARRKQRAYNLRNLRIGEFQSPNEFGLRVEVEVVKSAPSCSIFRFAELLEAALAAQKEVQEGMPLGDWGRAK